MIVVMEWDGVLWRNPKKEEGCLGKQTEEFLLIKRERN